MMKKYVIVCQGFAVPAVDCPDINKFLAHYDPDTGVVGRGTVRWTPALDKALLFDTQSAAFDCYMLISKKVPKRPDGKPNRPLTAYSVSIEPWEL